MWSRLPGGLSPTCTPLRTCLAGWTKVHLSHLFHCTGSLVHYMLTCYHLSPSTVTFTCHHLSSPGITCRPCHHLSSPVITCHSCLTVFSVLWYFPFVQIVGAPAPRAAGGRRLLGILRDVNTSHLEQYFHKYEFCKVNHSYHVPFYYKHFL